MERVIVVESAAKTKTIRGFLRGEYTVIACGGHIVDLPDDELGIDVEHDFSFELEPLVFRGTSKVQRVRERLADADEVYLATDPDREGEAMTCGRGVFRRRFPSTESSSTPSSITPSRKLSNNPARWIKTAWRRSARGAFWIV